MKTIPVEQHSPSFVETLKEQSGDEPVLPTEASGAKTLVLRLPDEYKETEMELTLQLRGRDGARVIELASPPLQPTDDESSPRPQLGRFRGKLRIIAEDDEHLNDFKDYL